MPGFSAIDPPDIHIAALPENEREAARYIGGNLRFVRSSSEALYHAAVLCDHCDKIYLEANDSWQSVFHGWMLMAARDGAMTIYHYGMSVQAIDALLKQCPALEALVDQDALKQSRKLFSESFPSFALIRHAVAHAGDVGKNPAWFNKHASGDGFEIPNLTIEPGGSVLIGSILTGRSFTTTFAKKHVTYDLNRQSVIALSKAMEALFAAFRPAERKMISDPSLLQTEMPPEEG